MAADLYTEAAMLPVHPRPSESVAPSPTPDQPPPQDLFEEPLRCVATLTVLAASAPYLLSLARAPERIAEPRSALWLVTFALFVSSFWWPTDEADQDPGQPRPTRGRLLQLIAQAGLALGLIYLVPSNLFVVFLVILSGHLGESLQPKLALVGVLGMTLPVVPLFVATRGWSESLVLLGSFLGFQVFAVFTVHVARKERSARRDLARVNLNLQETRARLAETSRANERLRIARDLHDVIGHHLTALTLNLEAARHSRDETAGEHVQVAHEVASNLLAEVRRVVSRMRDDEARESYGDLAAALRALGNGIARPQLHVSVQPECRATDVADLRTTLVDCAREMVTNAARHGDADNLWLRVEPRNGGVGLTGRDDGNGGPGGSLAFGNGLRGMRERLQGKHGRLDVETQPGQGFVVDAWLPTRAAATPPETVAQNQQTENDAH